MGWIGSTTLYPLGTPVSGDRIPYVDGTTGEQKQVDFDTLGFLYASQAWVEASGDDATGAAGDPSRPFETIDAALDATTGPTVVHIGIGAFAPITDDRTGSSVNPSSKLRSDLWLKGAKTPTLDDWTTPTTLAGGSIIKGRLNFHSTRHNVRVSDLGIDVGSAVCAALFGGTAQEGLLFNNIPQTASLAQARRVRVENVVALCKAYNSAVHAFLLENTIDSQVSGLETYYGAHGCAIKSQRSSIDRVISRGHSTSAFIFKDGGGGADVGPCRDLTATNLVGGSFGAGDTPVGLRFETGSPNTTKGIAISGVSLVGIATYDFQTINPDSGTGSPLISRVRVDGLTTDNGLVRTNIVAGTDTASVFINGENLFGDVVVQLALSDLTTSLTTGTTKAYVRAPYAFTVTNVRASVLGASSSGVVTVDINEAGTTILSTKLSIDASETTSTTAATAAVISDTTVADDALLEFDIDAAGTSAEGLIVTVYGRRG